MRLALEIYFGIILFWTGMKITDDTDWSDWTNYVKILLCPFYSIIIALIWIIDRLWYWFSTTFQIKFFWRHYILKRQYTKVIIDSWNMTLQAKTKNTLSHKIWRLCVRLANERFNKGKQKLNHAGSGNQ